MSTILNEAKRLSACLKNADVDGALRACRQIEALSQQNEERQTHQGYRNYETFALAVYILNDRELLGIWEGRARVAKSNAVASAYFTKEEQAELDLADKLKDEFEPKFDYHGSPYVDWLNAAHSAVDWLELSHDLLAKLEEKQ